MKAPVRASLLAAVLALAVAAPVFADPGVTTHESTTSCRTDEVDGLTYCFASEADITTKDKRGGASEVRTTGTIHATVVDADGNLVSSYDSTINERDVVLVAADGSAEFMKITIRMSEETTDAGVTSCTRTHVVIRDDAVRVNDVVTAAGPC